MTLRDVLRFLGLAKDVLLALLAGGKKRAPLPAAEHPPSIKPPGSENTRKTRRP